MNSKISNNKKRCAIFAHFDKNNKIQDYVLYYLEGLKEIADNIIFVSDCDLPKWELKKISKITQYSIAKRHGEYDFGSYKRGFIFAKEHSLLTNCDELVFCNDSCYGPLYPFSEMFNTMESKICDFWGATYNPKGLDIIAKGKRYVYDYPHIQSFFLVFKPQVFNSDAFANFINTIKKEENKWSVIINYEIGLTEYLNNHGFKHDVYCQLCLTHRNSHGYHFLKLILVDKCPILKTAVVRRKEYNKKLFNLIKKYTSYNIQLITKDLKHTAKYKKYRKHKTFGQKIFSIKNVGIHKVITILGIKLKIKSKKLLKRNDINKNSFLEDIFSIKNNDVHKVITICGIKCKIKSELLVYKKELSDNNNKLSYYQSFCTINSQADKFIPYNNEKVDFQMAVKLIAFYLPQFHTFKENEEWLGKGFTEWTNVTKAFPMYEGHFQPQLPIDVGFYDLSTTKVMYRQIELAKHYGIYGFCFHYYWFSGKRLMETPIFNYLNDKNLDFPFCLCWANENWSKKWDGGNDEVLMEQNLKDDDWKQFARDIAPFLKDDRYIKVENKPLLIIYRPALFERNLFLNFINNIRQEFKNLGIREVHLVMAKTLGDENLPSYYNMDAAVEFPIHCMRNVQIKNISNYVNPHFVGTIYDMEDYVNNNKYLYSTDYTLYKTVFPNWDNTARKSFKSLICETHPDLYKKWLYNCIKHTQKNNDENNQIVFINAWNEWAEGAHLEPDNRNGYAYLQATKEALEDIDTYNKTLISTYKGSTKNKKSILIISHDLSYSGAPLVLLPLIKFLKTLGIEVVILSLNNGPLFNDLLKQNIPVFIIDDLYAQKKQFEKFAKNFSLIFCNTLITYPAADILNGINKNFIWWIHESNCIVDLMNEMPQNNCYKKALDILNQSDSVFSVSEYASRNFVSKFTDKVQILRYGVDDFAFNNKYIPNIGKKLILTVVGALQERKGQDILITAMLNLPKKYFNSIQLNIIGDYNTGFGQELVRKTAKYNNIFFKGVIHFDKKMEMYNETDILVCISRDDPLPVVVTEAMICSIPSLITNKVGQSDLLTDGYDSIIIESENIEQLTQKLIWCVDNRDKLKEMGIRARKIYEKEFSIQSFEKNIQKILIDNGVL